MEFRELLKGPGPVILDGGMGTMLQAKGLRLGGLLQPEKRTPLLTQ